MRATQATLVLAVVAAWIAVIHAELWSPGAVAVLAALHLAVGAAIARPAVVVLAVVPVLVAIPAGTRDNTHDPTPFWVFMVAPGVAAALLLALGVAGRRLARGRAAHRPELNRTGSSSSP